MDAPVSAGEILVKDLSKEGDKAELTVLIVEAGRKTERLARLNDLLTGEQTFWAHDGPLARGHVSTWPDLR
ncbi:hypothetical protein [Mycobacterium ahvazicum]|uniref:hypothetical protein n=1 Tax=Mycobacterium ahvazicum TaxID=1964395 RepID=UPI000BB6BCD5|nr:hypothetical protein [Mycobacterium ahvazicum]